MTCRIEGGGTPANGAKPVEFKVSQQNGQLIYETENGLKVSIFSNDKGVPSDALSRISAYQKEDGTIVFNNLNNATVTGSQGRDNLVFENSHNNTIDVSQDSHSDNVKFGKNTTDNTLKGDAKDVYSTPERGMPQKPNKEFTYKQLDSRIQARLKNVKNASAVPGLQESIEEIQANKGKSYLVGDGKYAPLMHRPEGGVHFAQEPGYNETVYRIRTDDYYVDAFDTDNDGTIDKYTHGKRNPDGENEVTHWVRKDDTTFVKESEKQPFNLFKPSTWF